MSTKQSKIKQTKIEVLTAKLLKLAKGNSVYDFKKAAFRAIDECESLTTIS